jgi:hypothetical protein
MLIFSIAEEVLPDYSDVLIFAGLGPESIKLPFFWHFVS